MKIRYRIAYYGKNHMVWSEEKNGFIDRRCACYHSKYRSLDAAKEKTLELRSMFPAIAADIYIDSFNVVFIDGINAEIECV